MNNSNKADQEKTITNIPVGQLQANPLQPRGVITPDSIMDLVESIKEHGILEPLVVAHTPAGYQIIVGERRWRASKLSGKETVPCIIIETSPQGMLELALVENVQREDLNPIDRAKAFERLVDEFALTRVEIGNRIGKSDSYISNTLRLLSLPDAIKDGLLSGLITEGHARALQGIKDVRLMIEGYKMVLKESGSVRRAEEIARRMKIASGQPEVNLPKSHRTQMKKYIIDEKIDKYENDMKTALGEESKVRLRRSRAQTKLLVTLFGDPGETQEKLIKIYEGIVGIKPNFEKGQ
ncbi:stage 0 sporulation protein J [Candidatus Beckwithbacteria bacterium CG10_big_fil_rev_8_21_14_0_10_34_10]|uniref:Stage 0 sporulation protein J n=1 Tax=Candidatus Beckwithbacteria bacterium CG10_big_fil_rev_8_21_14_0_10_34_10 TaxID=1974495 RepID=A0A2H0WAA0_9BACT|nr:MAG: stage 0 sporulation protein J [Candidatus Beckwithbacteria bacterium CG10_big_fil_rev_8_21_14_0_10_34_10]